MRIEASTVNKGWYTVHVEPKELVTQSGKVLPYGTTVGVVMPNGRINLWYPAASHPRDYKPAAMAVLEAARQALREAGKVK